MVTPHLPWKFHANRSSRFLVMLLTKKQINKETKQERNRSKTIPRPPTGGGVITRNRKTTIGSEILRDLSPVIIVGITTYDILRFMLCFIWSVQNYKKMTDEHGRLSGANASISRLQHWHSEQNIESNAHYSYAHRLFISLYANCCVMLWYIILYYIKYYGIHYCITGMWSRSRRLGLETVSRRTNVSSRSRLGQSDQRLGLVSVSAQNVSASRLGSRTFSSRRDVSCRRTVHDCHSSSPVQTSMP